MNTIVEKRIEGIVKNKKHYNEDNGFYILVILVDKKKITIMGNGADCIKRNDCVSGYGVWETSKYGKHFKVNAIKVIKPTKKETILEYLSSGIIKGIGKKNAIEMVRLWGEKAIEVIDEQPELLLRLNGIGNAKLQKIINSWEEVRPSEQTISELIDIGFKNNEAITIYQKFKDESLKIARNNPYLIHRKCRSIDFEKVDEVALNIGIAYNSPKRILATLEHFLIEEHNKTGNCLIEYNEFFQKCQKYLKVTSDEVLTSINFGIISHCFYYISYNDENYLQFRTVKLAEEEIARRLFVIMQDTSYNPSNKTFKIKKLSRKGEKELLLSSEQENAIFNCINEKVSVLTGKPGAGKTTTLNEVIKQLQNLNRSVLLCAPTGKAAQRMNESTGLKASTIHRLLEFNHMGTGYLRNESNPLETDVIIIDESSMIDLYLMSNLLKAISNGTQIIIAGDANQLPSVQLGAVLRDLINSNLIKVSRLEKIYRQAATSKIITNAHSIDEGKFDFNYKSTPLEDFHFIKSNNDEKTLLMMKDIIKNRLKSKYNLEPQNDLQILAPQHEGIVGTKNLNKEMQSLLNENDSIIIERKDFNYKLGDKVIQIINNYDKNVFNGDCGKITTLNYKGIEVTFDNGQVIEYFPNELGEILPSYCMTIHKSQGSEYPAIIILLPQAYTGLIDRSLIYTGITRGKALVIVIGSEDVLRRGIESVHSRLRKTYLKKVMTKIFEESIKLIA